jgi:hypothetical protein
VETSKNAYLISTRVCCAVARLDSAAHRKREVERGSLAGLRLGPDAIFMLLDDALHGREADIGAETAFDHDCVKVRLTPKNSCRFGSLASYYLYEGRAGRGLNPL